MITYCLVPGLLGFIVLMATLPSVRRRVPSKIIRNGLERAFASESREDAQLLLRVRVVAGGALVFGLLIAAFRLAGFAISN